MASCTSGALRGIFETVCLAGGLSRCEFITATSTYVQKTLLAALVTSIGDIFIYSQKDGKSSIQVIPWSTEECVNPTALAFSPTAEWLLVAIEDGRICIIPVGKHIQALSDTQDHRFPLNDVVIHPANGSRARPTAIVWWQTVTGDASVAIIGTELGELCFVELTSGKDIGGTYITVPVKQMYLCQDNSQDTVYLLITGTEDRQWHLVLEQKSLHYMFPLESISPEWDEDENLVGPLSLAATAPSPRLRLLNLKQLSVEKFQLLKQRLSEAKHSSKRKPLTENKGADW